VSEARHEFKLVESDLEEFERLKIEKAEKDFLLNEMAVKIQEVRIF
jgi:hypothetical protein